MAISTGDICMEAINEVQTLVESRRHARLNLQSLCFIFKFPYELDHGGAETKLQEIVDWFDTQSWVGDSNMIVYLSWHKQAIHFAKEAVVIPSTQYSSG